VDRVVIDAQKKKKKKKKKKIKKKRKVKKKKHGAGEKPCKTKQNKKKTCAKTHIKPDIFFFFLFETRQ
jgi:hypothetical protein